MNSTHRVGGASIGMALAVVALCILSACATTSSPSTTNANTTVKAACATQSTGTPQATLATRACAAVANMAAAVQTTYDAQEASVKVSVRVGGKVPDTDDEVSAAQKLTKTICLREQQAIWGSGLTLKQVTVTVLGPIQDEYDNIVDAPYGAAVVGSTTATRLDWANLNTDGAWSHFDNVFLRPYFVLFD